MESSTTCARPVTPSISVWSTYRRITWRARLSAVCFAIVGTIFPGERGVAQSNVSQPTDSMYLSVRPHEMATATHNPKAGEYELNSVPDYSVSIPQQCVGARRCPLIVYLPRGSTGARETMNEVRQTTDRYGMILLGVTLFSPKILALGMREAMRRFAIDPNRIAIVGHCATADVSMSFGIANLNVFNRIVAISGATVSAGMDPRNKTAEFLVDNGILENGGGGVIKDVDVLRQAGHSVKRIVGFRAHPSNWEDFDFLGRWLQTTWSTPNRTARPAPRVVNGPVPELTVDILKRMTAFWASFMREPDSIWTTARRENLREVMVPGMRDVSIVMADMPALAAKYPSVAADLKRAGLTARQHETYRIALVSAIAAADGSIETPLLAKNREFMKTHPYETRLLEASRMWITP